ncbi:MAG: transporter substrate-binding domain-containing protein [Myxococcota bacterium]|nr:transporter substrate-binding domain-containing protein [Myxococcota bacterium]
MPRSSVFSRILPALAVLLLALACQVPLAQPGAEPSGTRLRQVLADEVLTVGLSGDQPPLNMTTRNGDVIGFEVDLALSLAESMGVEARFVTRPFGELIETLERGEVDIVISGMTMTAERNARVAFAGPYFVSGKSVLTKSASLANAESAVALDDPNRKYAALAGSTSEAFVRKVMPTAQLTTAKDYETALSLLISDQVEAVIGDYPVCAYEAMARPAAGLIALTTPFTVEPLGIAIPAGEPLFVNLVQNHLTTLKETGLLTQFKVKWFSKADYMAEMP